MIISTAATTDLSAIADLVNGAYRGEAASRTWTSEAAFIGGQRTSAAMLRDELADHPERQMLTLREHADCPLLGCAMVDRSEPEICTLGMLSVSPAAQNKGIGKHLIAAAEAYAREGGARRLQITVIQVRDTLIAWYERHGFVRTGATAPFPYDDQRFGVPLRDDLHFVVLEKPL